MNIKELIISINAIEDQLELTNFRVNGIDMWPRIRYIILYKNSSTLDISNIKKKYIQRIYKRIFTYLFGVIRYLRAYFSNYKKNDRIDQKRDVLFISSSNTRRMKYKNNWYDTLCDPLIDEIEKKRLSYLVLERSTDLTFKYPRYRKSKYIQLEVVKIFIKSLIKLKSIKLDERFMLEFNKMENLLEDKGFIDFKTLLSDVKNDASYIISLSEYFSKYLKYIKPKETYIVSWYGYLGMAICYACNKYNIPIYDIQHGVQGKYHFAYSAWNNIPSCGYNTHPSNYLNWSKEDSDNINQWLEKSNLPKSAKVKGNLIQEKFLDDTEISLYYDNRYNEKYNIYKYNKKILITLQREKSCPEYILELLKKSSNNVLWLIRFHPLTDLKTKKRIKKQIKKLNRDNYEIDFATEAPIYCLLRNIDLHITQESSVVIEAANFNVKSIITSENAKLHYASYLKDNKIYHADSYNTINAIINNILGYGNKKIA